MDEQLEDLFNKLNKPVYYLNGHGCTTCPFSKEYDRSSWLKKPWAKIPGFKAPKRCVYFKVPDDTIIVYMVSPGEFYTDSKWGFIVSDEFEKPGHMAHYLMRHSPSDLPDGSEPNPYASLLRCGPGNLAVDMGISFAKHAGDVSHSGIYELGEKTETLALSNKSLVPPLVPLLADLYCQPYVLISEIICRILHERPGGGIFVIAACASYQKDSLIEVADAYESHLQRAHLEFANIYPLISSLDGPIFARMNKKYPLFENDCKIYPPTMCDVHTKAFAKALEAESPEELGLVAVSLGKDSRGREDWEWIQHES